MHALFSRVQATHACETAQVRTLSYLCTLTSNTHPSSHTDTRACLLIIATKGLSRWFARTLCAFTSLHLPLCNNQALKYHQTNRGRGICAAFPGRRHATESPGPSSLSSSYASPPPDLLGTGRRRVERRGKRTMKGWVKGTERCKSREVSKGTQSGR